MATKAEAIMSPAAIVLAGAGTAVGLVAGFPVAAAIGLGAAAWGARVALAMPRKPAREPIRPDRLADPWRGLVARALDADRRFRMAVVGCKPGPLREHLESIATRVDDGLR